MNRRIASVRGLFEHLVMTGVRDDNPVPTARRASGLRGRRKGLLGHVAVRQRGGGRLVRQAERLPESLPVEEVAAFRADLESHRDRAMVLAMLLGGLRAAEVRSLRLADVDMGLRRVRVVGKGGRERVVPIDDVFFTECAAYLRGERPEGCRAPECFVVLRGPTRGQAMTEAGLRKVFRTHRARSGAIRVRPCRLRHTYGTELAAAGWAPQQEVGGVSAPPPQPVRPCARCVGVRPRRTTNCAQPLLPAASGCDESVRVIQASSWPAASAGAGDRQPISRMAAIDNFVGGTITV